jgi:glycerophosphoryl diester phosphodiesterase
MYNRRTFLKHSAMLGAAAATFQLSPALGSSSLPPANADESCHAFFSGAGKLPEVIAHRGGNGQWPGETLRAFRESVKLGVDVLEMDVFLSLPSESSPDGELMLMHDHEVDNTTNGKGVVNELSVGYLETLNAGHKWSPDGKCRPFAGKSVLSPEYRDLKVARLAEVFSEFPNARMIIEMKKADKSPAAALCKMIRKNSAADRVLVASFVGKYMDEFRELCPEVPTSFTLSKGDLNKVISGKKFGDHTADPTAIELPYKLITEDVVRRAHARKIKVHAWTVNALDKMYLMLNCGVDGIITDYPGPLLALLGRV